MIFERSSKWEPELKHTTEWKDQHDTLCYAVTSVIYHYLSCRFPQNGKDTFRARL